MGYTERLVEVSNILKSLKCGKQEIYKMFDNDIYSAEERPIGHILVKSNKVIGQMIGDCNNESIIKNVTLPCICQGLC